MIVLEKVKQIFEKLRCRMISGDTENLDHYFFTSNQGTGKNDRSRTPSINVPWNQIRII